ncbi:MAG TPA: hypothetical protein VNX21_01795 [Candidatus Thermoplasmatota archaeon]|nr:hypothetical protein [Candidatus Thermoplasmatota archaeon]
MSEDFTAEMPLPEKPRRRPTLREEREGERMGVGSFYAQHRAVVDARRDHLARLGMDPAHVQALRMPDLKDEPLPARGTLAPPVVLPVAATEAERRRAQDGGQGQ